MAGRAGITLLAALLGAVVAAAVALAAVGALLSRPAARTIGPPPADLGARSVRIETDGGRFVAGWLVPGRPAHGVVLLLHGVRADRTQMTARARFLVRAGYTTLAIDLPAHGESPGARISFGAQEAAGVIAALDFLRRTRPGERIGVIGVSLGAAAAVLAGARPAPDALVLESMYPTIEQAAAARLRMRIGETAAEALSPLLLWQLPLHAGVAPAALRPIDALPALGAPVLIASGTADRHVPWAETRRLFEAAAPPKSLWGVAQAGHVDLHAFAPAAYEGVVLGFLEAHLRTAGSPRVQGRERTRASVASPKPATATCAAC